jgi:hypothetical protein
MYGSNELKSFIRITRDTVECPVRNCSKSVDRRRKGFKRLEEFKCPVHNIYISPSTFEYQERLDNILWKDETDRDLLFKRICKVKRETRRFAHDNSEDAVTWNVFRYLEKEKLLQNLLSVLAGFSVSYPEVIYWSYSQIEGKQWSKLQEARENFETNPQKGSEPDLIICAKNALFLIETKLTATNNTVPTSVDSIIQKKYENGSNRWYQNVFRSDFKTVAITNKKYELLRFWLLGSKIAQLLGLHFFLVNLVLDEKEQDIEAIFRKHIIETPQRTFLRTTWENVYRYILKTKSESSEKEKIIQYFKNKTAGYDRIGHLRKAFSIE